MERRRDGAPDKFGKKYDKSCEISDDRCTDAGHDVPVNMERCHEFVWMVWTRQGKKHDKAEDDVFVVGRRTYTWNVDEMAPRPPTQDQRPTTDDQRPASNDQRPTTHEQRPMTNDP